MLGCSDSGTKPNMIIFFKAMAANEFVFDMNKVLEEEMEVVQENGKNGQRKEKERFECLVPVCKLKAVSFAHKFAL